MAKASSAKKTGIRRRERKNIDKGSAHIHSSSQESHFPFIFYCFWSH